MHDNNCFIGGTGCHRTGVLHHDLTTCTSLNRESNSMIGVLADALALHDGPSQVVRYEARADEMSVSGSSGGSHSTAGMPAASRAWTLLSNEYGSRIQYDRASSVLVMQRLSQSAQQHIVRWLRRYGLPSNITEISVSNSKRGGDHHPSEFVDAIMTSVAARCAACVEDDTLPR